MVAHTRMKTPTAVAEFLISGALTFAQQLNELETHFIELVNEQLEANKDRLMDAADQLNLLVNQFVSKQTNRLEIAGIQLKNQAESFLKSQQTDLNKITSNTKNRTERYISLQNHILEQSVQELSFTFRKQVLKSENKLTRLEQLLKSGTTGILRNEKKNLNRISEKLRLVDPQNILKRGYSLTLLNGKIVKSIDQISEGDQLETRLSDGIIESIVEKISNKE